MNIEELDVALDELENRLDRLRALYEQYFLGIEKIEPSVARKDVDRRFWILRRVKIRNTARRFRMQVLIQRYNTFQQYWARICREIENGTYVRHLLKAKKNLGEEPKTWAAKKRLGLLRKDAGAADEPVTNGAAHDDGSDLGALLESSADLAAEAERAGQAALESALATTKPHPGASAVTKPAASAAARPAGPFTLDDLGPLDLDFEDEPPPAPKIIARAAQPATPARGMTPASPSPGAPAATRPGEAGPAAARPSGAAAPFPGPARPAAPAAPTARAAAPTPASAVPVAVRRPAPAAGAAPPPAPSATAARPPAPSAGGPGAPGARSVAPGVAVAPGAPRPVARPAMPAPGNAGKPPAPSASSGLTDDRVKTLHAELVAARRSLKQTESVSVESLARSLREAEQKLRAQHQGRSVDFQVVVKDGKPVVKPVVRK